MGLVHTIRNLSIQKKNALFIGVIILISLAMTISTISVVYYQSLKNNLQEQVESIAGIISSNSVVAIEFNDHQEGNNIIGSLRTIPFVVSACIRDRDNREFSSFQSEDVSPLQKMGIDSSLNSKASEYIIVSKPILYKGETYGNITVVASLKSLSRQFRAISLYAIIILLIAGLLAIYAGSRLSRLVTGPISELAENATIIARDGDYTVKVKKYYNDEAGILTDNFNEMLRQISLRDSEIRQSAMELEKRVQERTIELNAATQKAQESEKLKGAFLANMSHEIRTPMNAILGFSQLLEDENLEIASRRKFVGIINGRGNDLLALINDIVDISKVEAGLLQIKKEPCSVNQIMEELFTLFQNDPKLLIKHLRISWSHALDDKRSTIETDPVRLKQILINLVSNAIKFTPEGAIGFGYVLRENHDRKELLFHVNDTGVGLSTEDQQIIFERFRQAEFSNTDSHGGTGLGLSISKALVNLLGGQLWVESKMGTGSTFFFTVPYEPADKFPEVPANKPKATDLQTINKTILIVDDLQNNAELIGELLRDKIEVMYASNGSDAVNLCLDNKAIGLVLMDMKMPGMNGFEAMKLIKKHRFELPVIVQTAYAQKGDRERFLEAGFDDYLEKPILKDKLYQVIVSFLG